MNSATYAQRQTDFWRRSIASRLMDWVVLTLLAFPLAGVSGANGTNTEPTAVSGQKELAATVSTNRSDRSTGGNRSRTSRTSRDSSTNAPSTGKDFAAFKIVSDRNIFNANRSGGRPSGASRPARAPKKTDTLALVGLVSYERGTFALFDGSSSEFRKSIQVGSSVGDWKLKSVGPKSAQLESNGKIMNLQVSHQLRREDGGEWRLSTEGGSYTADSSRSYRSASTSTGDKTESESSAASSDAGSDEVLKRLLQKREKEMNR